ncbi:hypothetical protein CAOG_03205 [Capsaspora owczarzaki ATCC 30864]|uniref:Uncharacterized protein n=1 Tax=Capsaspora owczarzaki (strain ATCC 30864) TaxID=595528 RepID=A0A0D2VP63_CAPO3|nr:hypothetical protein CAOG_03205 [Capsaspora owczarzaki ATCC 30864]KJE92192.1 hypothetical protein CAOG_003205 [Capsaspora owczarzaki ATCC 30864]|eukprot:XP_004364044.2 hypothetical protein CAOG_03205 [Capsaspora owczarzaki ATCC 30864]
MSHSDEHLPSGWERGVTSNGRTFYVDHTTRTTHWSIPEHLLPEDVKTARRKAAAIALGDGGPLPYGWEQAQLEDGEFYYVDHNRRRNTFTDPRTVKDIQNITAVPVILKGYLQKQGGTGLKPKNWKRRFFVLRGRVLYYYPDEHTPEVKGVLILAGYTINPASEGEINMKYGFQARRPGARTYFFAAGDEEDRALWMKTLNNTILEDSTGVKTIGDDVMQDEVTHNVNVPAESIRNPDHSGYMQKQGGSGFTPKNWRRRYFIMKGNTLYYYKLPVDQVALGAVALQGYRAEPTTGGKPFQFTLSKPGARQFLLIADSDSEMQQWISHLNNRAVQLNLEC